MESKTIDAIRLVEFGEGILDKRLGDQAPLYKLYCLAVSLRPRPFGAVLRTGY